LAEAACNKMEPRYYEESPTTQHRTNIATSLQRFNFTKQGVEDSITISISSLGYPTKEDHRVRLRSPMSSRRESENPLVLAENNRNTDISIEVGTLTQVILHQPQMSSDSPLTGSSEENLSDAEAKNIEDINEEMKSQHDRL